MRRVWILTVWGAAVGTFLAAPWPLRDKLFAVVSGICPQRPAHSLFLEGMQLPLEARMTGIFGGALITCVYLLVTGRRATTSAPAVGVLVVLVLFVAAMGADGFNATLYDLGLPHLYAPDNRLRLITGLLAGLSIGAFAAVLLRYTIGRNGAPQPALTSWPELAGAVIMLVPVYAATTGGWAPLYYPLAIVIALSVPFLFTVFNLMVVFGGFRRDGRVAAGAGIPLTVAFLMAVTELAGLALVRWAVEASLSAPT